MSYLRILSREVSQRFSFLAAQYLTRLRVTLVARIVTGKTRT